jgi:hypothetical protein
MPSRKSGTRGEDVAPQALGIELADVHEGYPSAARQHPET